MRRGPGLIGMAARTRGGRRDGHGRLGARGAQAAGRSAGQEAAEAGVQQAAPAPAAAPAEPDYMAELEQLAQLKAQGILSEEEFEAKKKQILGL